MLIFNERKLDFSESDAIFGRIFRVSNKPLFGTTKALRLRIRAAFSCLTVGTVVSIRIIMRHSQMCGCDTHLEFYSNQLAISSSFYHFFLGFPQIPHNVLPTQSLFLLYRLFVFLFSFKIWLQRMQYVFSRTPRLNQLQLHCMCFFYRQIYSGRTFFGVAHWVTAFISFPIIHLVCIKLFNFANLFKNCSLDFPKCSLSR